MQAIQAQNLVKRYGSVLAVDDVSFSVAPGEIFGFLGPNGAGKSTTQRMLTGVIAPDAGDIQIFGYDLLRCPNPAKQLMGIVPEMANVYVDLSAWNNLMFMGELYGIGKKTRISRAARLLEQFNLLEKKDLKAKGFSKGMKQRLLICMAMMNDPQTLFLDEPTSGLDVQSTHLIRNLLREFNARGQTIFLTTHNIEEANQLCDRVAIINRGRVVAIDRPQNLKLTLQSLQSLEVAFSSPLQSMDILYSVEAVNEVKKTGDKFRLYTNQPARAILSVVDLARRHNLEILSINTLGPSLEDVFLRLTGGQEKRGAHNASC
ncbi:ATP-binding cassette domain-containing protein [Desulfoscipio geothermicus]|uniref:ABC-2 type transport system ATP-binding protein n=1 Tax=Desulfoscipio geothermicus DSM 3669 TaxID=1121426 RepID=A0A1I6D205_9FIRM|nr:ATP-binding cassette domain-containing protein [Desulfoscipio geothermicus]SFQ99505.1 ABC-2 type transport system ATP-binding protein [Desulfoscipio geothermicus DSM 3669]